MFSSREVHISSDAEVEWSVDKQNVFQIYYDLLKLSVKYLSESHW